MRILTPFILVILLFHCPSVEAKRYLYVNFENRQSDTKYSTAQAGEDFQSPMYGPADNFSGDRTMIGSEGKNHFLKVTYPANVFSSGTKLRFSLPQPMRWAKLCYRVKVPMSFNYVKSGKLHGIAGSKFGLPSGGHYKQFSGFSLRIVWEQDGHISGYVYHPFQKTKFGDRFPLNEKLRKGRWNDICVEAYMNSPQEADGWFEITLNHKKRRIENFEFRKDEAYAIDTFMFSTFFGGGDKSYAPESDQTLYFDDFTFEAGLYPGEGAIPIPGPAKNRIRKIKRERIPAMPK